MSDLDVATLRERFAGVADAAARARRQLDALDALAGDGDLGETLVAGFTAVRDDDAPTATIGEELRRAGTVLGRAAPSSFGTLVGLALRDAGKQLVAATVLDGPGVVTMLDAVEAGIARRGEVARGDRSVLDAVAGVHDAAAELVANGNEDGGAALTAAVDGARSGAEATSAMAPKVGRAAWVGERAHGEVDAGAAAWVLIAAALADVPAPPIAGAPSAADPVPPNGVPR